MTYRIVCVRTKTTNLFNKVELVNDMGRTWVDIRLVSWSDSTDDDFASEF